MAVMEVLRTKESGDGRGSIERRGKAHVEKSKVSHRQEKDFCALKKEVGRWPITEMEGQKLLLKWPQLTNFITQNFVLKKN